MALCIYERHLTFFSCESDVWPYRTTPLLSQSITASMSNFLYNLVLQHGGTRRICSEYVEDMLEYK